MEIKALNYTFPDGTHVLKSVNLKVDDGQAVFVYGLNGSGKSTLALAAAGIVEKLHGGTLSGRVMVSGRNVLEMEPSERVSKVGLLMQHPETQVFFSTLRDELSFVLENAGFDERDARARTDELLKRVELLSRADDPPESLSQGQKQLLSLCVAIAAHPRLLILDEPDAFLDPKAEKVLWELVRMEKERGASVLIFGSWPSPPEITDATYTLVDGELYHGLPESKRIWVDVPSGHHETPVFQVKELHHSAGDRTIDINSMEIAGGITLLLGPTGSGKTTLTRFLVGLDNPSSGKILLMGKDISEMRLSEIGKHIGYLFQVPEYQLVGRTVEEEIAISMKARGTFSTSKLSDVLDMFQLSRYRNRFPLNLSGGEMKRVAMASVFATEPMYLVMDEPEANLDPVQLANFASILGSTLTKIHGALITSPMKSRLEFRGDTREIRL